MLTLARNFSRLEQKTAAPAAPLAPTRKTILTLCRPFEVKAVDDAERTFTGLAAAFSQDLGGDVILPGAFRRTLADWKRSKKILPLMDSHNYGSVRSVIGKMLAAAEASDGLEATFQVIEGPDGDEVFRRVKGGFVDGLSIGYRAIEQRAPSEAERLQGIWRFLKEIALQEISVVVWPMNPEARIDLGTVKALLAAADQRELDPAELEELKSIAAQIQALLAKTAPAPVADPPAPAVDPAADPAAPIGVTLAPDDPKRIQMADTFRELTLRALSAR
jgi:hypothetical protein